MIARLAFLAMLVVTPIVVFVTSGSLPARVATHFGRGGIANGWMPHDGYVAFMLLMSTLFPLLVAGGSGLLPAMARITLRRRAAHLPPARFEDTVDWLGGHAAWVGVLLCVLFLAIHLLTIEANLRTPARLDEGTFFVVMIAFLVLLTAWIAVLAMRLPRRKGR